MAPQTSPMVSAALATMQPKQEQQPAVPALSSALNTGILGKMVAASATEVAPRKIELYSR